jgi:hypothetical protein
MKFGLLYNTDYYPEIHGSASRYYAEILEQTELAEPSAITQSGSASITARLIRSAHPR